MFSSYHYRKPAICRVISIRHTAKKLFTICTHGKDKHTAKTCFAVCFILSHGKIIKFFPFLISKFLTCRNKKNRNLPCARSRHTAKEGFAVCQIKAHGKCQALPCAIDLVHDKVRFKFCKRSRMRKRPK